MFRDYRYRFDARYEIAAKVIVGLPTQKFERVGEGRRLPWLRFHIAFKLSRKAGFLFRNYLMMAPPLYFRFEFSRDKLANWAIADKPNGLGGDVAGSAVAL